jgi:hypothetical protein
MQSAMLVFSTQLCEPSLWFNYPPYPLPYVNKYTINTYTVCKGGVWGSRPQTDKHLPQSPFTGLFFEMTTFCIAFYESHLSPCKTNSYQANLSGVVIWLIRSKEDIGNLPSFHAAETDGKP